MTDYVHTVANQALSVMPFPFNMLSGQQEPINTPFSLPTLNDFVLDANTVINDVTKRTESAFAEGLASGVTSAAAPWVFNAGLIAAIASLAYVYRKPIMRRLK